MPHPPPIHPADLTYAELADMLAEAYAQDQEYASYGPSLEERRLLANYLGCHEEARNEAWEIWRQDLVDEGAAAYWLDVEFIQPCPEDQAGCNGKEKPRSFVAERGTRLWGRG